MNNDTTDPIYAEAVRIVKENHKAGTAFIQRKLRIGYNRAAQILEQMEHDEIVSKRAFDGTRIVLPSK